MTAMQMEIEHLKIERGQEKKNGELKKDLKDIQTQRNNTQVTRRCPNSNNL